jgi:hypothetical protein
MDRVKPAPTLADDMMREWSKPAYRRIDRNNWLSAHIAQARKFVLDDSMSAFMADLGYASLNACKTEAKKHQLIEGIRKLSRLPHATTWIEFNKQEHRKRVKEAYHPEIEALFDSVPDRSGWLLMQHPKLDTAFMALHCTSHSWTQAGRADIPNTAQFAQAWTCDDSIPPWPRDAFYHRSHPAVRIDGSDTGKTASPAGILTGVLSYGTDCVSVITAPHLTPEANMVWQNENRWGFNPLGEMAHDLRYLWSLLATINELPTSLVNIKPDKGYVSRGRYRRFCEHTVISLTVPVKRYQTVAKRAIAVARRRGHQVRGFWRKDHWHPGERIWVREHVRGDTSLGFVIHDYVVEHAD